MRKVSHNFAAIAVLTGLSALVGWSAFAQVAEPEWLSAHFSDHPLVGTVWTGNGQESSIAELKARAIAADFVLLGEIHPNPDHHRIQARILSAIISADRKPALVFEMIPARYQSVLDEFSASRPANTKRLGALVDWEQRGWPEWSLYQPVADIAVSAALPLVAGDLDRDMIRKIGREGASTLTSDQLTDLNLGEALPEPLNDRLREILRKSHCDLLPEAAIEPMMLVQRARDGAMAAALLGAGMKGADGAVLIAGAGHTRKDLGVPAIIRGRQPGASVVSVSMLAVDPELVEPTDYGELDLHDFVLFTPREDLTDHCAALADKMKPGP